MSTSILTITDWLESPISVEDELLDAAERYVEAGMTDIALAYCTAAGRTDEASSDFSPEYLGAVWDGDRQMYLMPFDGDPMGTLADYR